jgi:hypothetical protein
MSNKERGQNPVVGDDVTLRFFSFNSNAFTDVNAVNYVEIYYLDKEDVTEVNPDGRRLVATIDGGDVVHDDDGQYHVTINLDRDAYVIGNYLDIWNVVIREEEPASDVEQEWTLYPDLWYTSPYPIVYDFSFEVRPNRIRQGNIKPLIIGIFPNVPKASDLARYYTNLITNASLKISIEQICGDCMPAEKDLRLIVDEEDVIFREQCSGYYTLDTSELDCGLYDVWFKLELGGNVYISDNQSIEIFK